MRKLTKDVCVLAATFAGLAMASHADLADGLVLYYSMDNEAVSGVVVDESGKGNDGIANGTAFEPAGRVRGAYSFNGAGDLISVANPYIIEPWINPQYSVSLWFLSESDANFSGNGHLISDQRRYQIASGLSGSDKIIYTYAGEYGYSGGAPASSAPLCLSPDTWHHVTITVDEFASPSTKIYVDGMLVGSGGASANYGGFGLLIGAYYDGFASPGNFWNGLLDEVRVYDRILSLDEIVELSQPAGGNSGGAQNSVISLGLSNAADGDGNITEFNPSETLFIRLTDTAFVPGTPRTEVKVTIKTHMGKIKDLKLNLVGQADGSFLGSVPLTGLDSGETRIVIEGKTADKEKRRIETFITIK